MTSLVPLLIFAAIIHIALMGGTIFLQNLTAATPYYGGETGFLPSTGNQANTYDKFSAWLSGGGPSANDPGSAGGVGILQWAVRTPLCGMVSVIKFILSLSVLNYDVIRLIPSDGFGNWFKIIVHVLGALITIALFSRIVEFAIRAGVFSNVYLMAIVLGIAVLGTVATALNASGGLSCA